MLVSSVFLHYYLTRRSVRTVILYTSRILDSQAFPIATYPSVVPKREEIRRILRRCGKGDVGGYRILSSSSLQPFNALQKEYGRTRGTRTISHLRLYNRAPGIGTEIEGSVKRCGKHKRVSARVIGRRAWWWRNLFWGSCLGSASVYSFWLGFVYRVWSSHWALYFYDFGFLSCPSVYSVISSRLWEHSASLYPTFVRGYTCICILNLTTNAATSPENELLVILAQPASTRTTLRAVSLRLSLGDILQQDTLH